jgi:hypothetical protein
MSVCSHLVLFFSLLSGCSSRVERWLVARRRPRRRPPREARRNARLYLRFPMGGPRRRVAGGSRVGRGGPPEVAISFGWVAAVLDGSRVGRGGPPPLGGSRRLWVGRGWVAAARRQIHKQYVGWARGSRGAANTHIHTYIHRYIAGLIWPAAHPHPPRTRTRIRFGNTLTLIHIKMCIYGYIFGYGGEGLYLVEAGEARQANRRASRN